MDFKTEAERIQFEVFKKIAPGPALELTLGASKKHGHGTFENPVYGLGSRSSNVMNAKAGDNGDDADPYSTQTDASADTEWTWPNNAENKAFIKEYFLADTWNGYKPFHQSAATFYFQDVGWPGYDSKGKFISTPLPSIAEIVKAVWNLLSKDIQQNIKDWAKADTGNTTGQKIANVIYEVAKTALDNLGVPGYVIRIVIGVLVPRLVLWLIANINSLEVKAS